LRDNIDGIVITFVEIGELRRGEEAPRADEQLLRQERALLDFVPDPIFIWDFDGGIVEWNRGSEELYGFSRAEALGKRKELLLSATIEGSSFAEIRENLLRDGSWHGEFKHRTKDRRELTVESRIVLESIEGRRLALESTHDVTIRKNSEQRQQLLLGELTHRMKNTLAVVQAIAQLTLRGGDPPKDMVVRLKGRIQALARSHSLLAASDWKGADFDGLAKQQLEPYGVDNPSRIRLEGPRAILPPDLATPFALVLHELATNAAKYGSLSRSKGSVDLRWKLAKRNRRPVLCVVWQEKGGPPPTKPNPSGFGTSLIDHGIPNTRVRRTLKPEGLICRIDVTLSRQRTAKASPVSAKLGRE
jgi:two-component system CheB/CheR fusion protein